ncbi:hypothetical protein I4J89_22595 [Actinoplanes sp. NEAU-A11]|uniref:Uridine kinase n=1 Tax=Actinoplanes aureus TaxID=2792083 RepID=A0A931FZ16_9ACTN|nr:hypothetical protein [Actinoplanes aureus]
MTKAADRATGRPLILAIDGRGGAGKSSLAGRLLPAIPGSAVVHTDDVAWWHSRFGWSDLMADHVLTPLHAGGAVSFTPPAWRERGRPGSIEVPAGCSAVLVEGVGASRQELIHLIDVAVWVQSDFAHAEERGLQRDIERDGLDPATARHEWDEWMAEEIPFLSHDRPWERADFVVSGTPTQRHDPQTQVVAAPPFLDRGSTGPASSGYA